MTVEEVSVLIVGAGAAGLAAAVELARHGLAPLVVDRRPAPSDHPRATVVSTRSMELVRAWGLEDAVRAVAVDVEWRGWVCETLSSPLGRAVPLGLPTREQSAAISPTAAACVAQDDLEPLLERSAVAHGAQLRRGAELIGLRALGDGVEASLRDTGGEVRVVRAGFVIGADGARSAVRRLLDVPLRGPGVVVEAISTLVHAPLWRLVGRRRYGLYPITHEEAEGVFVPAGRGDRWIYGVTRRPGTLDRGRYDAATMERLIRLAAGAPALRPRISRIGAFEYAARLADRFRAGRAFLAGDAAHQATPRGGTGMNTALRDGYDIGWKLAWVLRGWAPPSLLDSYERERRPVAEHTVARSAEPDGSVREPAAELHVDLGGRIPHLWLPSRSSTLDLLGAGLTRFAAPAWQGRRAASWPAPVTLRRLPAVAAAALGIPPGGSLLVRPDGVPLRATG